MASGTPKTMSSRLLTMKFMQRAAKSAPNTPDKDPDVRSAKRQRLSSGAPSRDASYSQSDQALIQEALAAEERKRSEAIERQAAESGETRWVLSFQDPSAGRGEASEPGALNVVTGSYADVEASSDEEQVTGKFNFGKRKQELDATPKYEDEEEDSSEEEAEEDNDPMAALIREERKAMTDQAREKLKKKKKDRTAEFSSLGDARRQKGINLNSPGPGKRGGLSGGGGISMGGRSSSNFACHSCGEQGHKSRECPNRGSGKKRRASGRGDTGILDY